MKKLSHNEGFTMVEILIALVVLSVLVSIAAPSFNRAVASQRLRASANELRSSISLVRSEAVKRDVRQNMSVLARAGDWSTGWCVPKVDPSSGASLETDCTGPATNYVSDVRPPEGLAVSERSSQTVLAFNNWGRMIGDACFEMQAPAAGASCAMCVYVGSNGGVRVSSGACDDDLCSAGGSSSGAWLDACE